MWHCSYILKIFCRQALSNNVAYDSLTIDVLLRRLNVHCRGQVTLPLHAVDHRNVIHVGCFFQDLSSTRCVRESRHSEAR